MTQNFTTYGYEIIRNLIPKEEALSLGKHLRSRKDGVMDDIQAVGSPSFYADDILQKKQIELIPKIEEYSERKLFKTYTYARVYKKGAILRMHKDREACEISITLDLGGDDWDIWVLDKDENPIRIKLEPGDALLYRGCDVPHWRGKFEGDEHVQAFIHYVDQNGPNAWAKDDIKKQP